MQKKKKLFKEKINIAMHHFPETKKAFKGLSTKLDFIESAIETLTKGENPLQTPYRNAFMNNMAFIKNPLNVDCINGPKTKFILKCMDEKISNFGQAILYVFLYSRPHYFHIQHFSSQFEIDNEIKKIYKMAEDGSALSTGFVAAYEILNALIKIYEEMMYRNSTPEAGTRLQEIDLSCGGASFKSYFDMKIGTEVIFSMDIQDYIDDLAGNTDLLTLTGRVVNRSFCHDGGYLNIGLYFDFMNDRDFTRLNSYLQNTEIDRALSKVK